MRLSVISSVVAMGSLGLFACGRDSGQVVEIQDYLRAYIYQHVKMVDGEIATASFIGSPTKNELASIPDADPHIAALVLRVIQQDRAEHPTEYLARRHISMGESLGPDKPWDREAVQRNLREHFLGDPRWLRRILLKIRKAADEDGLALTLPPIPESQPLQATEDEVTEVCHLLSSYEYIGDGPACAANPVLAMQRAQGRDPMLVAALFDLGCRPEAQVDLGQIKTSLEEWGWQVSPSSDRAHRRGSDVLQRIHPSSP